MLPATIMMNSTSEIVSQLQFNFFLYKSLTMAMVFLYSNKTLTKPKRNNIILESCTEQDPREFNELITEHRHTNETLQGYTLQVSSEKACTQEYGKKTSHTRRKRPPLVNAFTNGSSTGQRG